MFISYYENYVGNKVYCWRVNSHALSMIILNQNTINDFHNSTSAAITLQYPSHTHLIYTGNHLSAPLTILLLFQMAQKKGPSRSPRRYMGLYTTRNKLL